MKAEIVNLEDINNIIIAYANGDFSERLEISKNRDARDSIIVGINMLGEELEQTMISRNYFSNVYNAVSDILIVTDVKGKIRDVNDTAVNKIKLAKEALINLDARSIVIDDRREISNAINQGLNYYHFETYLLNAFDEKIFLSCSISKITNKDKEHEGYLIIAKDITDKKNQEQQLLTVMISTEEKERKRLAYDLHDSLGQELNAVQMYLSSLNFKSSTDDDFKKAFEECKTMLSQSINTVRNLSFDLMPKSLENGCLCTAIEELTTKLNSIVDFNFRCQMTKELNQEKQIIIYRIFQEFINNSLKYALPCVIHIDIRETNNAIKFLVKDNGKGFDFTQNKNGNGIHNIKTRLKALNSNFNYLSKIGQGTELEFTLNYEND